MTLDIATTPQRSSVRSVVPAALLAAFTAAIGWLALSIEFDRSVSSSLADGLGLGQALFGYFRFFTILTNIGVATLMSVTAWRLVTQRALPPTRVFNAALIYILVTCVTYEFMLRHQWRPQGMQLVTDATIHDVVPALTLLFWIVFAPRDGARWRDALLMLVYPAAYFALTLVAGVMGAGYPYSFLDADAMGYPSVFVVATIFLAVFYALGIVTTAVAMSRARPR